MFKNKEVIVPPNMKLNKLLVKIAPYNIVTLINSYVQERKIK